MADRNTLTLLKDAGELIKEYIKKNYKQLKSLQSNSLALEVVLKELDIGDHPALLEVAKNVYSQILTEQRTTASVKSNTKDKLGDQETKYLTEILNLKGLLREAEKELKLRQDRLHSMEKALDHISEVKESYYQSIKKLAGEVERLKKPFFTRLKLKIDDKIKEWKQNQLDLLAYESTQNSNGLEIKNDKYEK